MADSLLRRISLLLLSLVLVAGMGTYVLINFEEANAPPSSPMEVQRAISPSVSATDLFANEDDAGDTGDMVAALTTIEPTGSAYSKDITGATFTFTSDILLHDLPTEAYDLQSGGKGYIFWVQIDTSGTNLTIRVREDRASSADITVAESVRQVSRTGQPFRQVEYHQLEVELKSGIDAFHQFEEGSRVEVTISSEEDTSGFGDSTEIHYGNYEDASSQETLLRMRTRAVSHIQICTYDHDDPGQDCLRVNEQANRDTDSFYPNMPSVANLVRVKSIVNASFGVYDISRITVDIIRSADSSQVQGYPVIHNYNDLGISNDPPYIEFQHDWRYNNVFPGDYEIQVKVRTRGVSVDFTETKTITFQDRGVYLNSSTGTGSNEVEVSEKAIAPGQQVSFTVNVVNSGTDSISVDLVPIPINVDRCEGSETPASDGCWDIDFSLDYLDLPTAGGEDNTVLTVVAPDADLSNTPTVRIDLEATITQDQSLQFYYSLYLSLTDLYAKPYLEIWSSKDIDGEFGSPVYNASRPDDYSSDQQFIEIDNSDQFWLVVQNKGFSDDEFALTLLATPDIFTMNFVNDADGSTLDSGQGLVTNTIARNEKFIVRVTIFALGTSSPTDERLITMNLESRRSTDEVISSEANFTVVRTRGIQAAIVDCSTCTEGTDTLALEVDPDLGTTNTWGWFRIQITNTLQTLNQDEDATFRISFNQFRNPAYTDWSLEIYDDVMRTVQLPNDEVTITKERSKFVYAHVRGDENAKAGLNELHFWVEEKLASGQLSDNHYFNLTLPVEAQEYYGIKLSQQEADKLDVSPGEVVRYQVLVENLGNGEVTINLRFTTESLQDLPDGWDAEIAPDTLEDLGPFGRETVVVTVSVPADARHNQQAELELEGEVGTTDVTNTATSRTKVNKGVVLGVVDSIHPAYDYRPLVLWLLFAFVMALAMTRSRRVIVGA